MKYKLISVILCMLLLLSGHVVFAESSLQTEFEVTEPGECFNILIWSEPETNVSIEIINPSADFPPKENTKAAVLSSFAYLGEVTTDSRGIGKLSFQAKEKTGTYTIRYSNNATKAIVYEKPEKDFFALTWPSVETVFDNVINVPYISVNTLLANNDVTKSIEYVKGKTENQPQGKKAIFFGWDDFKKILTKDDVRNYIWWDTGAGKIHQLLDEFFAAYKTAGETIDFIYLDLETYLSVSALGLTAEQYEEITADSAYASEIRPELEKRGFAFCADEDKGELYYLADANDTHYVQNSYIWDAVMLNRTADYLTYAVYEPARASFPNVAMSDYDKGDLAAWYKIPSFSGSAVYEGGNTVKTGTHSSYSLYGDRISGVSDNPPEDFNGVKFAATPFNAFLFDINRFKAAYLSDDEKKLMPWVAYDSYTGSAQTTISNTPYYAEMVFHAGMLDPDAFLFWVQEEKGGVDYDEIVRQESVLSLLLEELSAFCGKSSRVPIESLTPSWNQHYLISGMTVGEKNIWRITPDLSVKGVTTQSFMQDSQTPVFSISGHNISFENGRVLESHFGNDTCGYWVETASDVFPEITASVDCARLNAPIYLDFEEYEEETLLTADGTYNYSVKGSIYPNTGAPTVKEETADNNVLSVNGSSSSFHYFNFVQKLKVLGGEKKEQVWEIKIKLPSVSNIFSSVNLFGYSATPWSTNQALTIRGSQIYAPHNGGTVAVLTEGNQLKANEWYRIKRVMEFGESSAKSHIYVYDAADRMIGECVNTTVQQDGFPVVDIAFSTSGFLGGSKVLFDDFMVYPYGLDAKLEIYDSETGITKQKVPAQNGIVARLSYNNASTETQDCVLIRAIYQNDALQEIQTLHEGIFKAGTDGTLFFHLEAPNIEEAEERFFLWDSKSGLRPLIEKIEIQRE